MLFETLLICLTLTALFAASYSDIKVREVPDWLSYGLIFAAFGIRTIFSVEQGWNILISGIIGFLICFSIALAFYYSHQWGGGDSKLLMGMGAVIGVSYPFSSSSLTLLWFFFALLFLGAIYGLIWMVILAILKRKTFWPKFSSSLKKYRIVHLILVAVFIALFIFSFKYSLFLLLAIFPLSALYLFIFVSTVEECCFISKVSPTKLVEGDWLAEPVFVGKKEVVKGRTLISKDIQTLNKLKARGKLKTVLIKEGIPFVPSFLLAYLLIVFGI